MNIAFREYLLLFFLVFLFSCSANEGNREIQYPIELKLKNPKIQPLDSLITSNLFIWEANANIINHTGDTVHVYKSRWTNDFICGVDYYIVKSKIVYKGSYYPHSPIGSDALILPSDTITSRVHFIIEKRLTDMEDLFIKVSPEFSLSPLPFDTIISQHRNKLMKNASHRPSYSFHVGIKTKQIEQINFDIDSMIINNKYQIVKVNF